jgi:hypothetical protein
VLEASRERRVERNEKVELQKQHRAELRELNERIASLEAGQQEQEKAPEAEPPPLPPEELGQAVAEEPDEEEEDSLKARDRRKIATYQQKGLTGVPPEISEEIIRRARRDTRSWAALDEIDAQSEGYRTLREERDELVFAVQRQYPNDWAAMAREIHSQTDAWKVIEDWKLKGVPGLKPWESETVLYAVSERYPYNWSAALTDVAEEARKEVQARRTASAGQ